MVGHLRGPADPGAGVFGQGGGAVSAAYITRDTTPLTPGERLGNWYVQIVRLDDYRLITGPKRDLAAEYAREQSETSQQVEPEYAL